VTLRLFQFYYQVKLYLVNIMIIKLKFAFIWQLY